MFDWIQKLFNQQVEEEPPMTSESIRRKIKNKRVDDAERDARLKKRQAEIKEMLKLFPIGFPASSTEIALSLDEWLGLSVHIVLEKLVREEQSGWEYVNVDGCTLYQRIE